MIPKTEGIVLKSFDYRETSKIVTFFTKDYGKITGVMKGIRSNPRKFGSNADKFTVNHIVYYHYKKSDLHLISQCDLKHFYFPIRQNYKRNLAANYALELINTIMPVEEANDEIYQLMLDYLEALQDVEDIDKLVYILQIKILLLSGFRPHLDACVVTGKKIEGKARFSDRLGGLVAPEVKTPETTFTIISKGTVSTILHIEKGGWKQCLRVGLSPSVRRELKFILNNFLVYHLEKKLILNQT